MGKMDEDEIRKSIQDCVIPGNCDPAEVERLSVHGNEANTAENKFKELNDNDDSGLTATPSVQSRSSSISQGTNDRIDSDLDSITSASQLASRSRHDSPQKGSVRFQTDLEDSFTCSTETLNPDDIKVPILGFETMEERSRFTVFSLRVQKSEHDEWHIFRRYTDFVQLNDRLKKCFPNIRLSLPPKRWFRDNFDKNFIEDRQLGLQAFVDNCVGHKDICNSKPVREFFCFDDPPGPHDSIEESRALCESLEDSVYKLRKELVEKNSEIDLLHDELALYKKQVEMLTTALRKQNDAKGSSESPKSSTSLAECDLMTCTEADQSQLQNQIPILDTEGASDKCERAEKEACSATEERFEEGQDTPAQAKQHPVDTRSSPDDKATKKKKRSSIFKFKNKSSETTSN